MSARLYQYIETLWDYMQMHQSPATADCIFVLGSNDIRVAEHAADLYHQRKAPVIIFSGGKGRFTQDLPTSEAELFASVAHDLGVPRRDMILETQSTNSGENIQFTAELLKQRGLQFRSFILVQKPYMERRALATFLNYWNADYDDVWVTSTGQDFYDFCSDPLLLPDVVEALIGDFERIKLYPEKGFQIAQPIPEPVEHAYQALLKLYPYEHSLLA